MMLIQFSFQPGPIWSTNDDRRIHHHQRAAHIRDWKERTIYSYNSHMNRLKVPKALPPGIVQVTIPVKTAARRDPHNYCGTILKAIIDGMVKAGAWPDDTPEWVGHREPLLQKTELAIVTVYGRTE